MKKVFLCFVFALSVFLLASCGKEEEKSGEEVEILLYYLNPTEDGFETVSHVLEAPSDIEKSVAEVLYELSDTEGDNTSRYRPFMKGITLQEVTVDDKNVTIDFAEDYRNISSADEGLYRAAIVKSLIQIKGVRSVSFTINGEDLMDSGDKPIGPMNEDSFLIEGEKDIYGVDKKVTLYYADKKGTSLKSVKRRVRSSSETRVEKLALEELCRKPTGKNKDSLLCPLPEDLKINHVQILDNVCYVDLSDEILKVVPGVDEKITVYSMVHTLCAINSDYQVRFSVEGSRVRQLNNLDHFDGTFVVNPDYNKKKSK